MQNPLNCCLFDKNAYYGQHQGGDIVIRHQPEDGEHVPPPTGGGRRFRPFDAEFAIAAAAVFFLPFNFLRVDFAYITLSDLLCVASVGMRIAKAEIPSSPLGQATPLWLLGGAAMAGGLLLSSAAFGDPVRGVIVSAQYLFTYFIIPLVFLGRDWDQTIVLVKAFVAAVIAMCLFGVYLIHVDGQTNTRFVSGNGRLRSFVERSNEAASVIAMTVPLILWLAEVGRLNRLLALAGIGICVYGTMLTGSNTGLGALVCAVGGFLAFALSPVRMAIGGAAAGAVTLALLSFGREQLPAVFQRRVLAAIESGDIDQAGTFTHRLELILESTEIAGRSMLLGIGADQYRVVSAWEAPVHNAYLLTWTEGGFPALLGFGMIITAFAVAGLAGAGRRGARLHAALAACTLIPFALLINAAPHVYGRFWVGPFLCGLAVARLHAETGGYVPLRRRPGAVPASRMRTA